MNEKDIETKIGEMAKGMARVLISGKSVEINKVNASTIKFSEVKKKAIQ